MQATVRHLKLGTWGKKETMGDVPEKRLDDLSQLDVGQLSELFGHKRHDLTTLNLLNDELKRRNNDAANDLHLEVVKARRFLSRVAVVTAPVPQRLSSSPVRNWLRAFLIARNIARPDGRALYRYRMKDGEYHQLKNLIRHFLITERFAAPDNHTGALFVAYCAEWFRRESDSTFLRWDDPAPDLFPHLPYASKQDLTTLGLTYWQRPLRRSELARQFLLTVALEGGFPVRILAEGARGWLREYLRSIMRRAIALRVDGTDEIRAVAEEERGRIRKSYQHDDFVALCSELASSLLGLRKKVESQNSGAIRNSALLDAKYPNWRDDLPIYVPADEEALVTELLTGLLDEKMTGLATDGVEVRRYLVKRNGEWRPALQLLADGEIPPARFPGVPATARARAIATGELGNYLAGDVALFEPPIGEQRRWRVRPYMRTAKLLIDFPFAVPVTTTISSPDIVPCSWTWPRGEALRSDVLVFASDEGSTPDEPLLRFLRAGSVSSPLKALYVLVPDGWTVEPATEGAVVEMENIPSLGRNLFHLAGSVYVHNGEDDAARFKVEPDSDERAAELQLGSSVPAGFLLAEDDWELLSSPVRPLIFESGKHRPPGAREMFVRRPGGKWFPAAGPLGGSGLMELSWRDPTANIQLEKRRLVLVPGEARISGIMRDALTGEIRMEGLPGWSAAVQHAACSVESTEDAGFVIRFSGRPAYRLRVRLQPPEGASFDVLVSLVGREAVIALSDGTVLAPGRQIYAGDLRGAVAASPRKTVLLLGAKGSRSGSVRTAVDGELPLGILRSSINETFATLSNHDDLVEMDFLGDSRPPIRIGRYRSEQILRDGAMVHWLPRAELPGARPVVRMILEPRHEYALECVEEGRWSFPDQCAGPCLFYLRNGVDVVSRPILVPLPGDLDASAGILVSALSEGDYEKRQRAVIEALARIGCGESGVDDLKWLRDAVANLNGFPAAALDGLKLLPSSPETLIQLLLVARDAGERSIIWALQNELPFLWLSLPLRAWRSTIDSQCAALTSSLEGALGTEKAMIETLAWLRGVCGDLNALEPGLTAVFSMAGLPMGQVTKAPSLRDLTAGYIRGQHQRGGEVPNDIGVQLASARLALPAEIETKSHTDFAGLFAPVLLAASAQEKLVLDREQALVVRRVLREDPGYVSSAWPQLLTFYG